MEGNTAVGLRVLTKDGITDYGARIILDCTAGAFVAATAGCATECGRSSDGQMQPYTLTALTQREDKYYFANRDTGCVNEYDQWALSEAIIFSRSCETKDGREGRIFIAQAPILGIREGRRIISEETVRLEDLFADKQTKTPMFYSYSDLDKHGRDIAFDGEVLGDWRIGANLGAYNVTVAVPYKAILPKGYDGILVPCRALGVDRDITEELIRLICDPGEIENPVYNQTDNTITNYIIPTYKNIYFQFMSQAVEALIRIGDAHAELRLQIEKAFTDAFSSDDYYRRITEKPRLSSEGNMVQTMKTVAFSVIERWRGNNNR